jgi:lysyl-tRNA synthetase class 2
MEIHELNIGDFTTQSGRIGHIRHMKKYIFADLWDKSDKLQIVFDRSVHNTYPDSGDLISVSGQIFITKTEEKSLTVEHWDCLAKWKSATNYHAVIGGDGDKILSAFSPKSYKRMLVANLTRKFARYILDELDFFEIQTPTVVSHYNGGRSLPTMAIYLGKPIGFLRVTMEDRLKAVIASGFEKVFQIGSVFRGSHEFTMVEAFMVSNSWSDGELILRRILSYMANQLCHVIKPVDHFGLDIAQDLWVSVDFVDGLVNLFGKDGVELMQGKDALNLLVSAGLSHKPSASLEALSDDIASVIARKVDKPCIVRGFPSFASPLYCEWKSTDGLKRIQRSKGFVNGRAIFDLGKEENDPDRIALNISDQQQRWMLEENDSRIGASDLLTLAYGGLPSMVGFAISIDRLASLFHPDASINPMQ